MNYSYIKRAADITGSGVIGIAILPLVVVIAIWIKAESRGPVLFRQLRYGKDKVPFECLKFRTMTIDAPANSATKDLKDAHTYITFSGRIMRRLGIDELPQLINVLRGEMSLIGPRPVVLAEKKLIKERDKYGANDIRPGIGGWAQSNGRDEIDHKTKARLDGEYVQNFGLLMDISCLLRTVLAIFTSEGFKEGQIGDTSFRRHVRKNTHMRPRHTRLIRKIKGNFSKRLDTSAIDLSTDGIETK
jgi:O-antigen biosynthesis protein WbqP